MPQNHPANNDSLNIEKILEILPHRYPFLLVDKVLELEKGKRIVAIKNVTFNEPFFQGHFPAFHVMPGVLILEALAQAGGILVHKSVPDPSKILSFLTKVDNAKFRKQVVPGDQLRLEVEMTRLKSKYCQSNCVAYVNGEVAAECEIMASFLKLEELNA